MRRLIWSVATALTFWPAPTPFLSAQSAQSTTCPVTTPNGNRPPDAVLARGRLLSSDLSQLHGNGAISTFLWPGGTVVFRKGGPGLVLPDGSMSMKFFWLLATDDRVSLTGRRLDADAPPLRAVIPDGYVGKGFQPSGLVFPTTGCWEVTASAGAAKLTFVTAVVKEAF
jgi:hypothetical protein